MRLLIVTQVVDSEDPILGFFCRWIEEFAKHTEHIEVICLKEGKYAFPQNVHVHSLGKERGAANPIVYAFRFLDLVWRFRNDYDTVFVHMNQEYILIAGVLWKLLGKRVYMWRNHYAGSMLTDVAAMFCTKVFCTSKHSYTAKYKKTEFMPVGVDTDAFFPDPRIERKPHSILSLGRIAPSKRLEILIDALALLARDGIDFSATIVGSPLPEHEMYYTELKEKARALGDHIVFKPGVPKVQTPDIYRAHEIFVNTSPSGMLDKTIFEAAACGCAVLASSKDFSELAGPDTYFNSSSEVAERLKDTFAHSIRHSLDTLVLKYSLNTLSVALGRTMTL